MSRGSLSFPMKSQASRSSSTLPLPSLSTLSPGSSPGFAQMFGARSGWSYATPVSTIATTTFELPVAACPRLLAHRCPHRRGRRSGPCCGDPRARRSRSADRSASHSGGRIQFGSAYSTSLRLSNACTAPGTPCPGFMLTRPGTRNQHLARHLSRPGLRERRRAPRRHPASRKRTSTSPGTKPGSGSAIATCLAPSARSLRLLAGLGRGADGEHRDQRGDCNAYSDSSPLLPLEPTQVATRNAEHSPAAARAGIQPLVEGPDEGGDIDAIGFVETAILARIEVGQEHARASPGVTLYAVRRDGAPARACSICTTRSSFLVGVLLRR